MLLVCTVKHFYFMLDLYNENVCFCHTKNICLLCENHEKRSPYMIDIYYSNVSQRHTSLWNNKLKTRTIVCFWFVLVNTFILCFSIDLHNEKFCFCHTKNMFSMRKSWKHFCFWGNLLAPIELKWPPIEIKWLLSPHLVDNYYINVSQRDISLLNNKLY